MSKNQTLSVKLISVGDETRFVAVTLRSETRFYAADETFFSADADGQYRLCGAVLAVKYERGSKLWPAAIRFKDVNANGVASKATFDAYAPANFRRTAPSFILVGFWDDSANASASSVAAVRKPTRVSSADVQAALFAAVPASTTVRPSGAKTKQEVVADLATQAGLAFRCDISGTVSVEAPDGRVIGGTDLHYVDAYDAEDLDELINDLRVALTFGGTQECTATSCGVCPAPAAPASSTREDADHLNRAAADDDRYAWGVAETEDRVVRVQAAAWRFVDAGWDIARVRAAVEHAVRDLRS